MIKSMRKAPIDQRMEEVAAARQEEPISDTLRQKLWLFTGWAREDVRAYVNELFLNEHRLVASESVDEFVEKHVQLAREISALTIGQLKTVEKILQGDVPTNIRDTVKRKLYYILARVQHKI